MIEEDFQMLMDEDQLSLSVKDNLQHYLRLFDEFIQRYRRQDELQDLATKIVAKFNLPFILGSAKRSNATDLEEYNSIKLFVSNCVVLIRTNPIFEPIPRWEFQVMASQGEQAMRSS